jgi:dihydrolipoamide dehydrogenase
VQVRDIKLDDQCSTSTRNVWAIGDLTGEPMLAQRAMAQGEMVAEIISGKRRHFTPAPIAAVCFIDPEVVVAGQTTLDAAKAGLDCIRSQFRFAANGRAITLESTDGFVREVAWRDNHRIVEWQAVGACVSELSMAFSHWLEMGATLEDVAGIVPSASGIDADAVSQVQATLRRRILAPSTAGACWRVLRPKRCWAISTAGF